MEEFVSAPDAHSVLSRGVHPARLVHQSGSTGRPGQLRLGQNGAPAAQTVSRFRAFLGKQPLRGLHHA